MKIIIRNKDVSELVGNITFSGDIRSVARKLEFELTSSDDDYYVKTLGIIVAEGDIVSLFSSDGELLFKGVIIDIKRSLSKSTISYLAYDFMFYINNSQINEVYDDLAENIVRDIARSLGIKTADIVATNIKVYLPALSEKAYNAIMMAYTFAGRKNGKKYMPIMRDDKLAVIEKGALSGVVIDGNSNLLDASYAISLSKMVNKVLITDKAGKVIGDEKDDGNIKKYGLIQRVVKEDESKAKTMLVGVSRSINITALSDIRALAGRSLIFVDPETNIRAKFFIESDSHSFNSSGNVMNLKLNLENIMDEKEIKAR